MRRAQIDLYTGPTTLAIDVSAHQGRIDWRAVAASRATWRGQDQGPVRLAIVRTGDGARTRRGSRADPEAVRNFRGASDVGLPVAAYHYVRADHPADVQAEIMEEVFARARVRPAFVAIDLEGGPARDGRPGSGAWQDVNPLRPGEPSTEDVLAFCSDLRGILEASGRRVLMYTGVSWHFHVAQKGHETASWASVPLWTPYYTTGRFPRLPAGARGRPAPWSEWTLWQYTAKGRIAGIGTGIDLNRFRGDEQTLSAFLSGCG